MEEQKMGAEAPEKQMTETAGTETEEQSTGIPTRSYVLRALAGAYLVYTGYSLCRSVLDGAEGASGGFLPAGIAFAVIGVWMLISGARGLLRADKAKKDAGTQEETDSPSRGQTAGEAKAAEEATDSGKMTIAERAALVKRLEEDQENKEE